MIDTKRTRVVAVALLLAAHLALFPVFATQPLTSSPR